MPDWDEEALKELNSLDSARLAIRGALATIRDLQDQTVKLKADVQDEAARRKVVESRIAELNAQNERWQEQAKNWESEEKRRASDEERYRAAIRIQVRSEERANIQESQQRLEEDLSRLQAELQRMAQGQRQEKEGWAQVQKRLEQREIELVQAEREKSELTLRYRQDMDTVQQLREARDREIAASIKSRELEVADRDREILALRRQVDEHARALEHAAKNQEINLIEREEKLKREYLLKENALQERYAKREMELQSAWSEVENGLWKRAKDAREKLDKAAASQFEERARALADHSAELEENIKFRARELDDAFKTRCTEAEARYSEAERTLQERWIEKENRFLKKYGEEVAAETARLQSLWQEKLKAADDDRARQALEHTKKREELENEHRRLKENLLEESARKEAERIRFQDDLIARKTAELDLAQQERLSQLAQKEQALTADAQTAEAARREAFHEEKRLSEMELNRRRIELVDETGKALESARAAVDKQYEERARTLEASFEAKVAELDRARKAAEEQFLDFKARLIGDHGLKERNLDSRWAAREAELVIRQQTELEGQRADFEKRLSAIQDEVRADRFKAESELLARKKELDDHYQERDRNLRVELAKREEDFRRRYESELSSLRQEHAKAVEARSQNAALELSRARQAFAEAELRAKTAEEQLREAGIRFQSLWGELQSKERVWEAERLSLDHRYRDREALLEKKYQDMERTLQSLWSKKEAEAVEARLKALEAQHTHYSEQSAKAEENARRVVEEWRVHHNAETEKQKASWLTAREKDLDARRRALESDHEQKLTLLNAEMRKREIELQKHADEAKAQMRLELDEILREREKAYASRYAAQEREVAKRWAEEHAPPSSSAEPPKSQP